MTLTKVFADPAEGPEMWVKDGQEYGYDIWGIFQGSIVLERTLNSGITWDIVTVKTAPHAGVSKMKDPKGVGGQVRLRCTSLLKGMIMTSLTTENGFMA